MTVVTDIRRQSRDAARYSVYLDGQYSFLLSDLDLSMSGLRIGQELTADEVIRYQLREGQEKAYVAAVRYVGVRPRSRREVEDYLRRKAYHIDEAEAALERLERVGLVDDQAFAASWIISRQALRPRSRRVLAQELAAKGVPRAIIDEQLNNMDEDAELAAAARIVEKKRRLPQYADDQKLTAYMMRQGYSYETVKKAVRPR